MDAAPAWEVALLASLKNTVVDSPAAFRPVTTNWPELPRLSTAALAPRAETHRLPTESTLEASLCAWAGALMPRLRPRARAQARLAIRGDLFGRVMDGSVPRFVVCSGC